MRLNLQGLRLRGKNRGVALVLVLGFLVLITGLIIAFFSSVSTELSGAKSYASGVTTQQMADSVAQIVMAQISTATSGTNIAWASQPGMIRTYGDGSGGASPNELAFYKLYSSDVMVVTGSSTPSITSFKTNPAADFPSAWSSQPAVFTDLNAPVVTESGTNYPILDPSAFGNVEGANISGAPTAGTTNTAPMPTRWLYVLKDGTLIAPDSPAGASTTATFLYASTPPSATNPIVGRIAFWADDETCKVNINTASEGTFWDMPRVKTDYDYTNLAKNQPLHHEFQRYPGHPAMTSISTVFPALTAEEIYKIVPRVNGGGSVGGTVFASGTLALRTDRLYASLDELMFTPGRTPNNSAVLTKSALEASKFFLTAHSRAPETNLFNQPRVACWPIFEGLAANRVTPYDQLIAFCSSIPATNALLPYYFQRNDPYSTSNDIGIGRNRDIYSYLQNLTSRDIPGFGGKFSNKYTTVNGVSERDQILTEIFDYIRSTNLRDCNLAGGNTFSYWWKPGWGSSPGWVVPTHHPNGTAGFGRAYTLSELGIGFICNADYNESSSNITSGQGANLVLGGTDQLKSGEKYIQAIIVPEFFCPMLGFPSMYMDMQVRITGLDQLKITVGGVTHPLNFPHQDNKIYNHRGDWVDCGQIFGGNPSWRLFSNSVNGSIARGPFTADPYPSASNDLSNLYPFISEPVKISGTSATMGFTGGPITIEIYAGQYASQLIAENLLQTIAISLPDAPAFPIPNLVTKDTSGNSSDSWNPPTTKENWWAFSKNGAVSGKPGRLFYINYYPGVFYPNNQPHAGAFFLADFDVVRTVLPKHGDYRLVAARQTVESSGFVKHPYYDDPGRRMASNLTSQMQADMDQGYDNGGRYISSLNYSNCAVPPDIPSSAYQTDSEHLTPTVTGDFDSTLPFNQDGAFINKPDEGSTVDSSGDVPYFDLLGSERLNTLTYFSPNRQMPSPGMFGSLSTGVLHDIPWKTLLFRPQSTHPSYVDPDNYAASPNKPSDHLLLDLFWMPVVEPYAISDRFSTSGKINLNYQIVPFTYIERSTGIRALLKAEKVTAIPNDAMATYKSSDVKTSNIRPDIDVNDASCAKKKDMEIGTLSQFAQKFTHGGIFKSASEICDLHIVPTGVTLDKMKDFTTNGFWPLHALTGENLREKIYTTLYPRLTTKSNTFTVHFRVQALQKRKNDPNQVQWVEGKDVVTGENRGSTIIERYIDSSDPDLPDFATKTANPPINSARFSSTADRFNIDNYYKFRVVSTKQFAP